MACELYLNKTITKTTIKKGDVQFHPFKHIVLVVLASSINEEKEIKGIQIRKSKTIFTHRYHL
jgi:hypothetical protein